VRSYEKEKRKENKLKREREKMKSGERADVTEQ
jgi:hypothetical protein